MTKLHQAVIRGSNADALRLLDQGGIALDAQDDMGRTVLMLALAQGQNRVASKLLELGARTDLADKFHRTALDMARDGGNDAGRNLMLGRLDSPGVLAEVFRAARDGDVDTLTFLVEKMDAPLTQKNDKGRTPLDEANLAVQLDTAFYIEERLENFPDDAARRMHEGVRGGVAPMKPITFRK